jgi:leucyl-tRNA synthetase
MKKYNPNKIEKKWQSQWEKKVLFNTKDSEGDKPNYMLLTEFAYPSGDLHIGHWYAFALPDILARYLRMNGKNVLYPTGFDAFGLPAENAAIERDISPKDWTEKNIKYMTKQLKSMGTTFDWSRAVSTIDPEYYKWTQWMFIKIYEKGLAYRAKINVNWCPKDKTVLANEQVINGSCDRCSTEVIQKELSQWMFKVTEFADSLASDLNELDWPKVTKTAQRNWIGRSVGAELEFRISNSKFRIKVFTTRQDTLFGATYIVLAPEHELLENNNLGITNYEEVKEYIEKAKRKTELQRKEDAGEKTGIELKGIKAINPITNEEMPVWVADYVLKSYGTGAIMAVPAHDARDSEFAKKFKLPIKKVIVPEALASAVRSVEDIAAGARADLRVEIDMWDGEGELMNSGEFNGMKSEIARKKITEKLKSEGAAEFKINYRLHDWIISRQRYWGTPIPMVFCKKCEYQPVSEKDLPIELPNLKDYKPSDDGRSPLSKAEKWLKVVCPKCGGDAERETDTMDTFVDSSWYFLRYTDPNNKNEFAARDKMDKWLPVPHYIGGAEHNTMHLLYSRFFAKALSKLGYVDFNEPFLKRRNRGIILGPDNQKMSKSKGNVVDPDKEVEKFGADAVRMYLAFMGPYEHGGPWSPGGITGVYRFLNRVWKLSEKIKDQNSKDIDSVINKTVKKIGEDIEKLSFNTGVSELMKLLNEIEKNLISKENYEKFLKLLSPFAPHISEELWHEVLGHKTSIHLEPWPEYDDSVLEEYTINLPVQINGKLRDVIVVEKDITEAKLKDIVLGSEKVKKHIDKRKIKKFI